MISMPGWFLIFLFPPKRKYYITSKLCTELRRKCKAERLGRMHAYLANADLLSLSLIQRAYEQLGEENVRVFYVQSELSKDDVEHINIPTLPEDRLRKLKVVYHAGEIKVKEHRGD